MLIWEPSHRKPQKKRKYKQERLMWKHDHALSGRFLEIIKLNISENTN